MIKEDFVIDFKNKKISYNLKGSGTIHTVRELYSVIQDLLDDPTNMIYDTPIVAKSPTEFKLINGWKIEKEAKKHLKEGKIIISKLSHCKI